MRKILLIFFVVIVCVNCLTPQVHATGGLPGAAPTPANSTTATGLWVVDPEVTFIGKNAARAGRLLDWTLKNYNWVCVTRINERQCDDSNNPIAKFWGTIVLFIVVPMLFVVILATSIVIIITRGRSLTIMRFIPRFVAVVILIVFSYSILQFLYQFTDLIQGFFLRSDPNNAQPCPPTCISQVDLLYVGWEYQSFIGLRLLGDYNAESAFISLLLTKLTALTYFVMVGILLMRKIILWFFIIVSPIFPLLLLYYPVRNTGKIWIGEFFRWLLYAPLFAIFLKGLVYMWRQQIPLVFANPDIGNASKIVFPTAVNILLGGPRQFVTPTNSVNLTETFALYVVALIMLWMVLLMPWILLQIFLDYAANFSPGDNMMMKKMMSIVSNKVVPPGGPATGPQSPAGGGAAINLPFAKRFKISNITSPVYKPAGAAKEVPVGTTEMQTAFTRPITLPFLQANAQVMNLSNLTLPTMQDIARYETALLSNDTSRQQEVSVARETLEKIANPVAVASTAERERYIEMHDRLINESQQGNMIATTILSAASAASVASSSSINNVSTAQIQTIMQQIANPASASSNVERERFTKINDMLSKESKDNNSQIASAILSVTSSTSDKQIEKLREQLTQGQGMTQTSSIASSILSSIATSQQQAQSLTQIKTVLQQVANPVSVSNLADRERFTQMHQMLEKESKENNNQLASSILSVTDTSSITELSKIKERLEQASQQGNSVMSNVNSAVQTTQIKHVLQQIANPASTTNSVDREKFSKLHEALAKESKENNNQLASSILSVSDKTTVAEIEKLKEQLSSSKESIVAQSVVSTINNAVSHQQATNQIKSVLQQAANPTSVTNPLEREKMNKLNQTLKQESQKGNELASSLLNVSKSTTSQDVEKLKEKLMQAKEQGSPIATQLLNMIPQTEQTTLPTANRLQAVSQRDFEDVKKMWKENYHNLEIPQGMAGSRTEWMKDDVGKINSIIEQLSSTDQDQIKQGMEQVSNILPFLLVGGFSQAEIVSYLQAKQQAAQETIQEVAAEEETMVTVEKKQAAAAAGTMAAQLPTATETVSPIENIQTININQPVEVSNEILQMVNLKVPKMRDIARFETMSISKDKTQFAEVQKVQEVLGKIANPNTVSVGADREKYEKLKDKLTQESQKGNNTASVILSAANSSTQINKTVNVKKVLQQIANPTTAPEINKQKFTQLNEQLTQASQQGNKLAASILSIKDTTSPGELEKLRSQLEDAKAKGETIATAVLSNMPAVALPATNNVQSVDEEEFEEVKKMWKENYHKLEVPEGMAGTREDWIKDDIEKIDNIVGLLSSSEQEKINQGMDQVSNILPFLLVGGFSQAEIISYLQSKQLAAKETLVEITKEEETMVTVQVQPQVVQKQQTVTTPIYETPSTTSPIRKFNISDKLLEQTKLQIPSIQDVVKLETKLISKDNNQKAEIEKTKEILRQIADPSAVTTPIQKQEFEHLKNTLIEQSKNGNETADIILRASWQLSQNSIHATIDINIVKKIFLEIINPETISSPAEKEYIKGIHEDLIKEKQANDKLADALLAVKEETINQEIESIYNQLKDPSQKDKSYIKSILSIINNRAVPSGNTIQVINREDYDAVKKMWEENYRILPVPLGFTEDQKGRTEWLQKDIEEIKSTLDLLSNSDTEKKNQGMERVGNILPFLLLGGFSYQEIVTYLQTKLSAAETVLVELKEEADTQINSTNEPVKEAKTMPAEENQK